MAPAGDSTVRVSWTHNNTADVFQWVVYRQYGTQWEYSVLPRSATSAEIRVTGGSAPLKKLARVAVAAVDRTGNESVRKESAVQ
jgi:hypothetical protein